MVMDTDTETVREMVCVNRPLTEYNRPSICTQCKFDRDGDGHRHRDSEGDGMCKQALILLPIVLRTDTG